MKRLIASFATMVFAGPVSAADDSFIYHGFEVNNPDLYSGYAATDEATAAQPGMGDNPDRSRTATAPIGDSYAHWVRDNPDDYSGFSRPGQLTGMHPGIGDRSHDVSMQRQLDSVRVDSYDLWTKDNPDQEDGH